MLLFHALCNDMRPTFSAFLQNFLQKLNFLNTLSSLHSPLFFTFLHDSINMWYVIFLRFQDIYQFNCESSYEFLLTFFLVYSFRHLAFLFGPFRTFYLSIFFFGLFRRRTNDRQNTNARNTNSGRVENGEEVQGGTTTNCGKPQNRNSSSDLFVVQSHTK